MSTDGGFQMRAVRWFFAGVLLIAAASASAQDEKKGAAGAGVAAGVKGTVYGIDGNKHKDTKVTAQVHDVIVIEWTYPVVPPFPKSAEQKSSDDAVVKTTGIHRLVEVNGPIGVGHLAATFNALKQGHATATFTVNNGKEDITMKCQVTVK
jgi:hypothetical protein